MDDSVTRADLIRDGWSVREIAAAVHAGTLIRLRRGHYATPSTPAVVQRAVRVGGRVTCVSELRFRGVWVLEPEHLHVQVAANAARLRNPDDRTRRRAPDDDAMVHWGPLVDPLASTASHASISDAILTATRCLSRREMIAALDSALNLGLISLAALRRLVAKAGGEAAELVADLDGAAQSGLESIVRVVARDLGLHVQTQVRFAGIGVVDLLIEGWIVVETDGSAFHDAVASPRDRRRDALHAAAERTPLRFRYGQVMYELPDVVAAIIGAVGANRHVRNSGRIVARALRRTRKLGLS